MKRIATSAAALAAAAAVTGATLAAPAQAAPASKGNTEVIPNAVLASILVGVEKPFAMGEQGGVEFGITGNPRKGVVKHVGGITITDLAGVDTFELRNFWIVLGDEITVSAVVNGGDRVTLFDVEGDQLVLNATASSVLSGSDAVSGVPVATVDLSEWKF